LHIQASNQCISRRQVLHHNRVRKHHQQLQILGLLTLQTQHLHQLQPSNPRILTLTSSRNSKPHSSRELLQHMHLGHNKPSSPQHHSSSPLPHQQRLGNSSSRRLARHRQLHLGQFPMLVLNSLLHHQQQHLPTLNSNLPTRNNSNNLPTLNSSHQHQQMHLVTLSPLLLHQHQPMHSLESLEQHPLMLNLQLSLLMPSLQLNLVTLNLQLSLRMLSLQRLLLSMGHLPQLLLHQLE
jgi:hypothetical protein